LQEFSEKSDFWNDAQNAQKIMQQISENKEWLNIYKKAETMLADTEAYVLLAEEEKDEALEEEINSELAQTEKSLSELEIRNLL